ncbi:MAG: winged helix-turn-helix domain-containing protein [Proteobacteria bacterium]|nr:winged helix-turn-helix domain-containing protein [Pseudomonadota bacterium]
MGKIQGGATASRRQGRHWRFASATFDEATWILTVDGQAAPIEGKPLELLHELLLRAGELASKEELLAAVWPDVSVVEASLTTAMLKLRRALGDGDGDGERAIIETVPRIGYRLAAPVEMTFAAPRIDAVRTSPPAAAGLAGLGRGAVRDHRRARQAGETLRRLLLAGGLLLTLASGVALGGWAIRQPAKPNQDVMQQDAKEAIRKLDVVRIEGLIRAGWNPNTAFDTEGNGALNVLLNMCEWDPGHDRRKMVLMARTLMEAGARLDSHNMWGDTAYSIAKAPRYCGPDHPVTQMIHTECYAGFRPLGDRCLAVYQHGSHDE